MLCYLPYPYDDELLYSVVARYLLYYKVKRIHVALENIFGRLVRRPRIALPGSLNYLSESTKMSWNMSPREIADRLTLFPYYSRYLPLERVEKCFNILCSNYGMPIAAGLALAKNKTPEFLRFCHICRESDVQKNGETYWRRSHQLAGVLVCPKHGELLTKSNVPFRGSSIDYIDATIGTDEIMPKNNSDLDDADKKILWKVAKRCQEMLRGPIPQWDVSASRLPYRNAAFLRELGTTASHLNPKHLEASFMSFYGERVITVLGLDLVDKNDNWLRTILRAHRQAYPPLKHAAVQLFLESLPIDETLFFKKRKRKNNAVPAEQIILLRNNWEELLSRVPNRCPDLAYEINPKLYKSLLHNDRKWLYASGGRLKTRSPYKPHINWVTRDEEWSAKLKTAALHILNTSLKRVTKNAMLSESGLISYLYSNLDRLPLCKAVIKEYSEEFDDWQERRIRAVEAKARKLGNAITPSSLTGLIRPARVSPRIKNVIEELLRK